MVCWKVLLAVVDFEYKQSNRKQVEQEAVLMQTCLLIEITSLFNGKSIKSSGV